MLCFAVVSNLKWRKFKGKIKMVFGENNPQPQDSNYPLNHWRSLCKKSQGNTIVCRFAKVFDSIHRGKMEQILQVYGLPKEIVTAIIMLYRNMKVKAHSLDGDTDFFNIIAGVLQGDILAPYLFIICLDSILQMSIGKWLYTKKAKSRQYPTETIMNTDYADDITLLVNTPTQAKSLKHCLEQAAGDLGLCMNTNKMEYMSFNQEKASLILNGNPLKLVDMFSYLSISISSIKSDVNIHLAKVWTAISWLVIIRKSDLSAKIR